MALTRRQFLARTGMATAGSFFGPGLANPFLRQALADTIGDRYLVVVFLDGGNDGLNTVTPIANGDNLQVSLGEFGFRRPGRDDRHEATGGRPPQTRERSR